MNKFTIPFLPLTVVLVLLIGCNEAFEGNTRANNGQSGTGVEEVILHKGKFKSLLEYVTWVNDTTHGFIQRKSLNGINYMVQYKPELIRALERYALGTAINNNMIASMINDTAKQKMAYFYVKITGKEDVLSNGFNTEKSVTEYFGYHAEKDFMLIQQADTLYPVLYHFENTYPQFPYLSVLLAFELPEDNSNSQYQTVVFNGDNKGSVKMQFNKQQIFNQPEFDKINEIWQ